MIEPSFGGRCDSCRSHYRQGTGNHKTVILRRGKWAGAGRDATKFPPICDGTQQPLPARDERGMSVAMTEDEMRKRRESLRVEHRDLDAAIAALAENPSDQLRVARLKKRKLVLKDQIMLIEDALIPDIIA